MFLHMLKMVAQPIASTSSHKWDLHKSIKGFKFDLLRKWLLIAFCLENSLTNSILDGMNITFGQSCIILGQFVCHSKLLPHVCQTSNIVLFSHSCQSVSVNHRSSPLHISLSSWVYWNFNNIILSHNFDICDSILIIVWILMGVEKFGCIEYWRSRKQSFKAWTTPCT